MKNQKRFISVPIVLAKIELLSAHTEFSILCLPSIFKIAQLDSEEVALCRSNRSHKAIVIIEAASLSLEI